MHIQGWFAHDAIATLRRHTSFQVIDWPQYKWRGVLLDVGRHFFPVAFVKKVLDLMAVYKLNMLHWHLTEDQVRLPVAIKPFSYPYLAVFNATH